MKPILLNKFRNILLKILIIKSNVDSKMSCANYVFITQPKCL